MSTIDHLAFPHIVDLIFAFAPIESLAALGTACRDWDQRTRAELHHLRSFTTSQRPPLPPILVQSHHFQTLTRGWATARDPLFLKSTRVLDLPAHRSGAKLQPLKSGISVHTVRIPEPRRPMVMPSPPLLTRYA